MKTILCPTDFSQVAQNAILYAVEFAQKCHASLILFHTEFIPEFVTDKYEPELINIPSENVRELKDKLESLVSQVRMTAPEVKCSYVLEEGLVAENIALYANNNNIDLIIIGTSGASGFEAIFAGSNSVRVMEKSKCPVLIIPEDFSYREPTRFVYAADLLDNEEEVVEKILKISEAFDASLELLHVQSEDTLEVVNSRVSMGEIVNRHLNGNVRYKIIQGENSITEIEEYAKQSADILVLAQRKKSFIEKLFSKNRTENIAYHAKIPVLVIHKA
jgi:nucleotide-binding universal stress UspA family protein